MPLIRALTAFDGRIYRKMFWAGIVVTVLVFGLGRYVLKQTTGDGGFGQPDNIIVMLWSLLAAVPITALMVKRLADRGRPAWLGYVNGLIVALFIAAPAFGYLGELKNFSIPEHVVFWTTLPVSLFAWVEAGFLPGVHGTGSDTLETA